MSIATSQQTAAVLFTTDVAKLARFYERVVGMTTVRTEPEYCVLHFGTFQLTVHAANEQHAKDIVISSPPALRDHCPIKLSFHVDSLARARLVAPELGGHIYGVDREWNYDGKAMCDGYDPDGNVIQLFETLER